MMRIGLVVPGFSADPSDWCIPALRHLARSLASHDDVRVIAMRYPYASARYTIDGAETIALGGALRHGLATFDLWRTAFGVLREEHRRRPFDVLHAFWATESGLLAATAGRLLGVPTLVSLAGGELVALRDIDYGDQRLAWERLKVATSLRLASAVSAGSRQLATMAEFHLSRRRSAQGGQPATRRSASAEQPGAGTSRWNYAAQVGNDKPDPEVEPGRPRRGRHLQAGPAPGAARDTGRGPTGHRAGLDVGRRDRDISAASSRMRIGQPRYGPPVHVAPLGVDLDLFSPATSNGALNASGIAGPRLLHVGTLTPVKDHALLLRAFASINRRGTPATLQLVGDGPLRPQIERLVRELDLDQHVHFHGELDHAHLPPLYRAADACIVSSRHEAQCMVALEAAACGTPILGTRVGVIPELTTAVAPVGDTRALAEVIVTTLTSHTASSAPDGPAVTTLVRSAFGLETCAERFRALYVSISTA
jgi:glycosyltransferase involved in cell wall biosynthesis